MSQHVQNILSVYHRAGRGEIDAGLRWYLSANEEAERISKTFKRSLIEVSAVIAVLSPGLRWERNVGAAERVIAKLPLDGLGVRWYDGVRKAERILQGEPCGLVVKGNKVNAFWDNIAFPYTTRKVCVDGHAYAIWSSDRTSLDEVPSISDDLYLRIEDDYIRAASVVGVRPLQLQAITWTTWRRLHKISQAHYLPLFEEEV